MAEKTFKSRIILKHDTEANWAKSSFIPQKGEAVIIDIDETYNYERMKLGDGVNTVPNLPFVDGALKAELLAAIGEVSALVGDTAVSEQIAEATKAMTIEEIDAICGEDDVTILVRAEFLFEAQDSEGNTLTDNENNSYVF